MTKRPRLLGAQLTNNVMLYPISMSVELQQESTSTATMELAEDDVAVAMHDFVEVFTPRGSAGIFRATNIDDTKRRSRSITLMHAIDTLSDSVWSGQTDYNGTVAGFLAALLAQQAVARWQLGTCSDQNAYKKAGINYDRLSDLLDEVRRSEFGYHFTFDFSTSPWTLNMVADGNTAGCEFRLDRNVESCEITRSDSQMCNRLFLSVNHKDDSDGITVTKTEIKIYNNTTSQSAYGIIEKTADIDLENVPSADAWAAEFLNKRAHPAVEIKIDALALQSITGEAWDEARLGEMARVSLPEYNEALEERVVGITYPELVFDDADALERMTVQLANHAAKFSETIASIRDETKKNGKAVRAAGRGGASASEMEQWAIVVSKHGDVIAGTGLETLYESGIVVDAQEGITIYSLAQGFQSNHAEIKVQSDRIGLVVQGTGPGATIKTASIVAAINNAGSSVMISADKIILSGETIADIIDAEKERVDNLLAGSLVASKLYASTVQVASSGLLWLDSYSTFTMHGRNVEWKSKEVVTGVTLSGGYVTTNAVKRHFLYSSDGSSYTPAGLEYGYIVTGQVSASITPSKETIYYLGSASAT